MTLWESLATYYGLDWASFLVGTLGLYLLGEQRRVGFLFTFTSLGMAALVAIIAGQYGFLFANFIQAILAIRGYWRWQTVAAKS